MQAIDPALKAAIDLIPAAVGFTGVLVGAALSWWRSARSEKWERTLDLHREFFSERMSTCRSQAFNFLRRHPGLSLQQIDASMELEPQAAPLWEVIYFYSRLALLLKHRQVVSSILPDLFGDEFIWWYICCFEKNLIGSGWKSAEDIEQLWLWFNKRMDSKTWQTSVARHTAEREQLGMVAQIDQA